MFLQMSTRNALQRSQVPFIAGGDEHGDSQQVVSERLGISNVV